MSGKNEEAQKRLEEILTVIRNTASELIKDIDRNLAELTKDKEQAQEALQEYDEKETMDSVDLGINDFLENLVKNNKDGMLKALYNAPIAVSPASFTKNGNAVESQEDLLENGKNRVSVRFYNQWDPLQVGSPTKAIKQKIEIVFYEDGKVTAILTLAEKKSMSLNNAESNYHKMLNQWKSLTKQREITFNSVAVKNPNRSILENLHNKQNEIKHNQKGEHRNIEKMDRRMER